MGLFSSLIAFLLQQKGIKKIGPVKASIYTNLIPIYSIILSSLILKERVTLIQIIAMILVMLAIIINMETKKIKKLTNERRNKMRKVITTEKAPAALGPSLKE